MAGRGWPHASQVCCHSPPVLEKDIPMLSFLFCLRGSGDMEEGIEAIDIFLGPSRLKKYPNRLVWAHRQKKRIVIRGCVRCLPAFNGTHIHWGSPNWRRDGWRR